jgi:hypothetical protein
VANAGESLWSGYILLGGYIRMETSTDGDYVAKATSTVGTTMRINPHRTVEVIAAAHSTMPPLRRAPYIFNGGLTMPTATAAPVAAPMYDVAISFLFQDQRMAQALHDELATSGLNVFFFPRRQEELAGTNGMESMRTPFLGARVNVVLFHKPWGETPWTRIEDAAISERCFNGGWSTLMFVQIDKTSTLPAWLPPTHVRFSFDDYGLTQLVGAIKLRVQEQGGVIKRVDAIGKAETVRREADYLADRDRLMRDTGWIGELQRSIRETMDELGRLASKINASQSLNIVVGPGHFGITIVRSGYVSMAIGWQQPIANYVGDSDPHECHLWAAEHSGMLPLRGEKLWYVEQPKKLRQHKFKVDVAGDRGLMWRVSGKDEYVQPSELADYIMRLFLDLLDRANQGKVERPRL